MTDIPPMAPSAEERFDATMDNGGTVDHILGIAAIERAYRDGFLAAVALLRGPSEELVETVACAEFEHEESARKSLGCGPTKWSELPDRFKYNWLDRTRAGLTAIAAKLEDQK